MKTKKFKKHISVDLTKDIAEYCMKNAVSLRQFAKKAGVCETVMYEISNGKRPTIHYLTYAKIKKVLEGR